MERRRCDRIFHWSCGRYQRAGRCGRTARFRHAGACVTEREAGRRADRIGGAVYARSSAARGNGRNGEAAAVGCVRPAAHTGDNRRRRTATGRPTTRRAGARHKRDSHVCPTQKDSACQRPCPTIL
ncbi:hypothetical protein DM992_05780 [Burkholderia sp. JP2-270]|nr:hypothetical protein DM992_05780 [Burkholderia sp. JP2-270]